MTPTEANRFKKLYQRHLRLLKLQGKSQKTIDAYSRAVRRISEYFDSCPDQLTPEQLETYFGELVDTHSWTEVSEIITDFGREPLTGVCLAICKV